MSATSDKRRQRSQRAEDCQERRRQWKVERQGAGWRGEQIGDSEAVSSFGAGVWGQGHSSSVCPLWREVTCWVFQGLSCLPRASHTHPPSRKIAFSHFYIWISCELKVPSHSDAVETVEPREGRLIQWVSDGKTRRLRMWPLLSEVSDLNPSSAAYRSGGMDKPHYLLKPGYFCCKKTNRTPHWLDGRICWEHGLKNWPQRQAQSNSSINNRKHYVQSHSNSDSYSWSQGRIWI